MSRKHEGPVLVTHNTSRAAEAAVTAEEDEEVAGGAGSGKEREEEEQQEESAWRTRIIRHNGVVSWLLSAESVGSLQQNQLCCYITAFRGSERERDSQDSSP